MTDARNVYPRLCWGCLGVIEDYEHDRALMTYGGFCAGCHCPEMPGLRDALRGQPERMNDVSEREELLREVKMSDEELATGGVIEPGSIPYVSDDPGPEIVFLPRNAQVYPNPTLLNPGGPALQWNSYSGPWANPTPIQFVPSNTFPTEQDLRAFVKKCVDEHLDELARTFNEHPGVQPGTWRKEGE